MTHGDDSGLVLPPSVAPVQAVIIPISQHKAGVLEKAVSLKKRLEKTGLRVKLDDSDNSAGWKFAEYEMKGVPLRLEVGPKDIEQNQCVLIRRDTGAKTLVSLDSLETAAAELLSEIGKAMYEKAKLNREAKTYRCGSVDEIASVLSEKGDGFILANWCGSEACEDEVKEKTGAGSRCIPFDTASGVSDADKCVCCGKKAEHLVLWGKAY